MPVALPIALGVSAAAGIGSAAMSSGAAKKAGDTQAQASMYAADLQKKAADEALAFQKQTYADQQRNIAPWLNAGTGAINTLASLMSPGGQLTQGWNETFRAPTASDLYNDPSYQFRLAEGQKALERSAASRGGLLSGGTAKALNQYTQDYASNEYNNKYNRAMGEYQQKYNEFNNNQANIYNRYAGLAGVGQTAATNLNSSASQTANNAGNILMTSANNIGNAYQNAAAARASGYVGSSNAWSSALGNLASLPTNYLLMNKYLG